VICISNQHSLETPWNCSFPIITLHKEATLEQELTMCHTWSTLLAVLNSWLCRGHTPVTPLPIVKSLVDIKPRQSKLQEQLRDAQAREVTVLTVHSAICLHLHLTCRRDLLISDGPPHSKWSKGRPRSLSHSASQIHLLGLPWLCFLPEGKNII